MRLPTRSPRPLTQQIRYRALLLAPMSLLSLWTAPAQQQPTAASSPDAQGQPVAFVATQGVTVAGSLRVENGRAAMGNNSTVTAEDKSAEVTLVRGGSLRVCATTSVHISRDALPLSNAARPPGDADSAGLMLALDRGAFEARYSTGRYSDVLLTPDLRILVSGPGLADLSLRVNRQGDTCVDNHGDNAPYVTVSSLMDGGVYRVQPNQRVLFERGSLQQVVDREPESCGCPDAAAAQAAQVAAPAGKPVGGPSSTPADTAFPTAVSEGLAPAPAPPSAPVVPAGEAHAQVTASLSSDTPPGPAPETPQQAPVPPAAASKTPSTPPPPPSRGILGRIGHFFARVFGKN